VTALLPAELAEKHRLVPVALDGRGKGTLVVAMSSPRNLALVDEIAFRTGRRVSPVLAPDSEIDAALFKYYGIDVSRHTRSSTMVQLDESPENDGLELGDVVVQDRQQLAHDFLPTVTIK
jgi:type IV pilus assembly protein PilB